MPDLTAGALPPFPGAQAIHAPPSWRCIDFVSDLHLHAELPRTTAAFVHYLAHTRADAVFILGDLFEAWVGDDMRHEAYEGACTTALADYGRGHWLGIMVGNRDFLLGADMAKACHAHLLDDPVMLMAFGQSLLLTHGDALCLADTDYLRFRAQVRTKDWQAAFLTKPLAERLAIAAQMRMASAAHQQQQAPETWADVDAQAALSWMTSAGTQLMVHGHTHRPGMFPLNAEGTSHRVVLSDWDLDHTPTPRGEILRLTPDGLKRIPLSDA